MNKEENEHNKKLYKEYAQEANKRILSNIENYDKAILSLSVTILGLSIAFIKNIVPFEEAKDLILLERSWGFLLLAVISTIMSFLGGIQANKKHIKLAEDYYLNDNDEAFDRKSKWTIVTELLNIGSGVFFILGIIMTVYFAYSNIENKGSTMSKNVKTVSPSEVNVQNGATPPSLVKKRGATPPAPTKKDSSKKNK
jgi:hypothetical protein